MNRVEGGGGGGGEGGGIGGDGGGGKGENKNNRVLDFMCFYVYCFYSAARESFVSS